MLEPNTEIRHTNDLDFWVVARTNSLGFPDREPPPPERAAASCHVAVIGDSFVAAIEVPIADKLQVRLEALAAVALPELDVTVSAYGRGGTGQVNQLPLYDEYARRLSPNLVVLVFDPNDFENNSAVLSALRQGHDPRRMPYAYPERTADGGFRLRPADPGFLRPDGPSWYWRWLGLPPPSETRREAAIRTLAGHSLFARWLDGKRLALFPRAHRPGFTERAALLAARPGYEWVFEGWRLTSLSQWDFSRLPLADNPPPAFAEALEFTAWVLAEFKRRADRDGAALIVLSTYQAGDAHTRASMTLRGMAGELGIPVINQYEWIANNGYYVHDAHWPHDAHWNPQGHQWAAEAILDWLRRRPEVCED